MGHANCRTTQKLGGRASSWKADLVRALDTGAVQESPPGERTVAATASQKLAPRADVKRGAPSPAQARLWFLERLHPGESIYYITAGVRMRGTLDVPALSDAFHELVARHEVLRACFGEEDGQPVLEVVPRLEFELPLDDLRSEPAAHRRRWQSTFPAAWSRCPLISVGRRCFASVCCSSRRMNTGFSSSCTTSSATACRSKFCSANSGRHIRL